MAAAARGRDTGLLIGAPEAKKRKVTKKEYVPNIGTANYALLLTLLKVWAAMSLPSCCKTEHLPIFSIVSRDHMPQTLVLGRPCAVLLGDTHKD